jgi:hypothetical protein
MTFYTEKQEVFVFHIGTLIMCGKWLKKSYKMWKIVENYVEMWEKYVERHMAVAEELCQVFFHKLMYLPSEQTI